MLKWLLNKATRTKPQRLELKYLNWVAADILIRESNGAWTIAPEEDNNKVLGMVWIERIKNEHR